MILPHNNDTKWQFWFRCSTKSFSFPKTLTMCCAVQALSAVSHLNPGRQSRIITACKMSSSWNACKAVQILNHGRKLVFLLARFLLHSRSTCTHSGKDAGAGAPLLDRESWAVDYFGGNWRVVIDKKWPIVARMKKKKKQVLKSIFNFNFLSALWGCTFFCLAGSMNWLGLVVVVVIDIDIDFSYAATATNIKSGNKHSKKREKGKARADKTGMRKNQEEEKEETTTAAAKLPTHPLLNIYICCSLVVLLFVLLSSHHHHHCHKK